jgi:hypothetical protein
LRDRGLSSPALLSATSPPTSPPRCGNAGAPDKEKRKGVESDDNGLKKRKVIVVDDDDDDEA